MLVFKCGGTRVGEGFRGVVWLSRKCGGTLAGMVVAPLYVEAEN